MTTAVQGCVGQPIPYFVNSMQINRVGPSLSNKVYSRLSSSSESMESASYNMQEKNIVALSNLWSDPVNLFVGGILGFLWVALLIDVVRGAVSLGCQRVQPDETDDVFAHRQWSYFKQFLFDSISWIGLTGSTGDWAHQAKIISLGNAANHFKMNAHGASTITSSVRAWQSLQDLLTQCQKHSEADDRVEQAKLQQKELLSILDLTGYAATALWAGMSFSIIAFGLAIPGSLVAGALIVACIFAFGGLIYRMHLESLYA